MDARTISTSLIAALLFGCVSHEGTYSPDCIAFAGSNISLSNKQFVWEKFTDMVVVDDNGEVVNQFPGFPLKGSYRIDGQTLHMESDAGVSVEEMYLHRHENRQYLLTAEQFEAWQETGTYAGCALMLDGNPDD